MNKIMGTHEGQVKARIVRKNNEKGKAIAQVRIKSKRKWQGGSL